MLAIGFQAALLLVNLTSQPMSSGSVETAATVWQGPIVRNEETQVICLIRSTAFSDNILYWS